MKLLNQTPNKIAFIVSTIHPKFPSNKLIMYFITLLSLLFGSQLTMSKPIPQANPAIPPCYGYCNGDIDYCYDQGVNPLFGPYECVCHFLGMFIGKMRRGVVLCSLADL